MSLPQAIPAFIVLATAVAVYSPASTWLIGAVFVLAASLYAYTTLSSNQVAMFATVVCIPLLAFLVPIPLPQSCPPLIRLVIITGLWSIALIASLSLLLRYNMRYRTEKHQE